MSAYITINKLRDRVTVLEEVRRSRERGPQAMPGRDSTTSESCPRARGFSSWVTPTWKGNVSSGPPEKHTWIFWSAGWRRNLTGDQRARILYCGSQDILEDVSPGTILDNVGTLLSTLQQKCETTEFYVCEIVPTRREDSLNDRITSYYSQLIQWSQSKVSI